MIPMLRRRLMSNMAKAKNIATGTVDMSYTDTLTINGIGFKPDHILVGIISPQYSSGSSNSPSRIWTIFDNQMLYYSYSDKPVNTNVASIVFTNDGVRIITKGEYESDAAKSFTGTYRYVAWQE